MKSTLKKQSSLSSWPDDRPDQPSNLPPTKGGPGTAHVTHTHTGAGGPPSSSQTPAPAHCYCHTVIATSPGYIDEDGEEHDAEYYYRHCELHDPGKKDCWSIASLGDLMKLTDTTFTKEGRAFWKELRKESDKRNPYIPELERAKREIEKADQFLTWCEQAREEEAEWNQQYNVSLSKTGEGIPYPDWLRRFSRENQKSMEARRDELFNEKLEIQQKIVNWRYKIQPKGGGNP